VNGVCQTEVVPEYCTCGAQLPPDARFCHKCGKPQYDYAPEVEEPESIGQPPAELPNLPYVTPIQLSGEINFHNRLAVRVGFIAALAAVFVFLVPLPFPFLRLLVAFIAGGFFAVFLYTRRTGQMLSIRSGARMGWITGIFSFTFVSILFTIAMVAISNEGGLAKYLRSQLPANDSRSETVAQVFNDPATLGVLMLFSLVLLFIVLTALPIIGGALGAKIFEKE
jgi:zinc-ribbon domain